MYLHINQDHHIPIFNQKFDNLIQKCHVFQMNQNLGFQLKNKQREEELPNFSAVKINKMDNPSSKSQLKTLTYL